MSNDYINTIIKVTENCNFDCSYCLRNVNVSSTLSLKTIDLYFQKLSLYHRFNFIQNIWHGGEPLLMGTDFYEEASSIVHFYFPEAKVTNSIQTNGYFLDKYIDFFKKKNFGVGISLDGPEDINNNRVLKSGESPFNKVLDNMRLLRENGIHYGTVGVLTTKAIGNEQRIYDFLRSVTNGARLNLISPDGLKKEKVSDNGIVLTVTEASRVLINLYDIWKSDKPINGQVFQLRPFYEIVESMFSGKNRVCEFSRGCAGFLCLGCDGTIYPCGRFSSNKDFIMGNIYKNNFEEIFNSSVERIRQVRIEIIDDQCNSCQFKCICHGGCAHHSYAFGNYIAKTPYCQAYHTLFEHIKRSME